MEGKSCKFANDLRISAGGLRILARFWQFYASVAAKYYLIAETADLLVRFLLMGTTEISEMLNSLVQHRRRVLLKL